jgi:hypothetical protein
LECESKGREITMEDLFNECFKRKSIRLFKDGFSSEDQEKVTEALKKAVPLDPSAAYEFTLEKPHGRGGASVCLYMKDKEPQSLVGAGYLLEQADLILEQLGYGVCFLGTAKPDVKEKDGLIFVMMLDVGLCDPNSFRQGKADFTRKYINDIWEGEFNEQVKDCALLSPSALNGQAWYLKSSADQKKITVYKKRAPFNPIPDEVMRFFHFLDAGILLCHLELGLVHEHLKAERHFEIKPEEDRLTEIAEYEIK